MHRANEAFEFRADTSVFHARVVSPAGFRVASSSSSVASLLCLLPFVPFPARPRGFHCSRDFHGSKATGQPRDGLPSSSTNFGSFQANAADRSRAVDRS